jgi:hypothetical protein
MYIFKIKTNKKNNLTEQLIEYPYADIKFYDDYVNRKGRRYTYKNPHKNLKVGDVVNVKTGFFSIFPERVFVMALLKESEYKGRLKEIGRIVSKIDEV